MLKKKIFLSSLLLAMLLVAGCASKKVEEKAENNLPVSDKIVKKEVVADEVQKVSLEIVKSTFSPDAFTVKKGIPVEITITSTSIADGFDTHGFSIKDFGINETIAMGETKVVKFTPDKVGNFVFFCSVFCGDGHIGQSGIMSVVENELSESNSVKTEVVIQDDIQGKKVQELSLNIIQGGFEPSAFTVKVNVPVKLTITASSIDEKFQNHGFSIKDFGVNETIAIGETKVVEFTPDKVGNFVFFCSVFCGEGHQGQSGIMTVIE